MRAIANEQDIVMMANSSTKFAPPLRHHRPNTTCSHSIEDYPSHSVSVSQHDRAESDIYRRRTSSKEVVQIWKRGVIWGISEEEPADIYFN
jgi:hypothetical protein